MGLLTDPGQRRRFVRIISQHNNKLCAFCYIVGLMWFLGLAYSPLNADTYFSENALLPGLVEGEFFSDTDVKLYSSEIKKEMVKDKRYMSRSWLHTKFRELGLDAYIQNYTVMYPLHTLKNQKVPGQNVYAILRAPRSASTEALVLSTPIRSESMLTKNMPDTSGGVALMMALAKYFKQHTYWAKDIIFLLTQHEHIGVQAWLDGYHQSQSSNFVVPGEVWGRSGSIQAALNLEIPAEKVNYYNIKMEGLNGQLPNLDLFNLVVRLCRKEGRAVRLHHQSDHYDPESFDGFLHSLKTMMRMMVTLATGTPSGNHGLFHRYHIEAVTLQGIVHRRGQKSGSLMVTGRIIEGIFRSLNNLLERFHQSFFFYILPATDSYISIGLYMPPFGLLVAAGLLKISYFLFYAIAVWIGDDCKTKTNNKKGSNDGKEEQKDENDRVEQNKSATDLLISKEGEQYIMKTMDVITILPVILLSVLMGLLAYYSPDIFSRQSQHLRIHTDEAVTFGLLALFCACMFFPRFVNKKSADPDMGFQVDWPLLKCVALLFQCLTLFSISLINICLAFFLAMAMIPVSVVVQPVKNRWLYFGQSVLLLLVSPPVLIYLAVMITVLDEQWHKTSWDLFAASWNALKEGILLSILNNNLLSSWTYSVFCFAIFPNWIMLWGISRCE